MSEWMNLFSIKMGRLAPSGCCKSCARIPKLHREILNSKSCVLCRPHISPLALGDAVTTSTLREQEGCEGLAGVKGDPQIYFTFISAALRAQLLKMHGDFQIALKKKKKGLGEIKSCFIASPRELNYPLA